MNFVSILHGVEVANVAKRLHNVAVAIPINGKFYILFGVSARFVMLVQGGIGPKKLEREDTFESKALAQALGLDVIEKTNVYSEVSHAFLLTAARRCGIFGPSFVHCPAQNPGRIAGHFLFTNYACISVFFVYSSNLECSCV